MEPAGQGAVLRAKAETFEEQRKTGEMPEGLLGARPGVAVGLDKNEI